MIAIYFYIQEKRTQLDCVTKLRDCVTNLRDNRIFKALLRIKKTFKSTI